MQLPVIHTGRGWMAVRPRARGRPRLREAHEMVPAHEPLTDVPVRLRPSAVGALGRRLSDILAATLAAVLLLAAPVAHHWLDRHAVEVGADAAWRLHVLASLVLAARWRLRGALAGLVAGLTLYGVEEGWLLRWHDLGQPAARVRHLTGLALNVAMTLAVGWLTERLSRSDEVRRLTEANLDTARRAEEALRTSERRFRSLAQHASDVVGILNADGTFRYVSPSVERALGYRPGELIGGSIYALIHSDDRSHALNMQLELLDELGVSPPFECRLRGFDGSWRRFESVATNLLAEPSVNGIVLNARDVTERREAEDALRASEERFRTLFENAHIGIYRLSPDGAIVLANPALTRMLGCGTPDELLGQELPRSGSPGSEAASAPPGAGEPAGDVNGVELAWMRRDGAALIVRLSAKAVRGDDGTLLHYDGTVEDITEHRRLTAQLAQVEKLSALGEMAAGVAHEVNNPLAAVSGTAELALRGDLPPQLRDDLTVIHREAARAGEIVRGLLRFARQREPSFEPVQLAAIVDEALALRGDRLARLRIDVARETTPAPDIRADQDQLLQVVLNLVNNAADAMKAQGGGRLAVSVQPVTTGVELAVRDSGPGIAPEVIGRILDPFFTTKAPGEGTGLGLSISHRIVTDHGGTLTVANHPDRGACFRAVFPAVVTEAQPATPTDGGLVLIVHPDPMAADLLAEAVRLVEHDARRVTAVDEIPDAGVIAALVAPDAPHDVVAALEAQTPPIRLIATAPLPAGGGRWHAVLPHPYRLSDVQDAIEGGWS